MDEQALVSLHIEQGVATLTLQRAKQLNALNQAVIEALSAHLDTLQHATDVRVVILRGEGRAFAAGADIAQMSSLSASEAERFARLGQAVFRKLELLPQPTIALVHGFALGGGMELAMACDVRIAAEGAKFGQPEVTLGVIPGFGGSQRLPKIVGRGRALTLLLTGDLIDAATALDYGLVTQVVPGEELAAAGQTYAQKLANLGPQALGWVKRAVYDGSELELDKGLSLEAALFGLCFSTEDQTEGMAAFLGKRTANFQGRL